ncbi:MAG: acetyl-CoA carboxylase carboxyltransferase subunit alpha [Erysipelotrichaceae bacterium]
MSLQEKETTIASLELELSKLNDDDKKKQLLYIQELKQHAYDNLDAWDKVYAARHPLRPKAIDYIHELFPDFIELHGDRLYGDDAAIVGGLASFHNQSVTVIAQSKGKTLEDNMHKNFGMVNPEGYRKAMRLAKQAEKFNRPVITIVDTPGAYPGIGAEERGQAESIAKCLQTFSTLKVPVICLVISEGGSGGALALTISDNIIMLENAIYSILSPEGFATILWKDAKRAKEASEVMKITAQDLLELKIIDKIIKEPKMGIHNGFEYVIKQVDEELVTQLNIFKDMKETTRTSLRYKKFRSIGTL